MNKDLTQHSAHEINQAVCSSELVSEELEEQEITEECVLLTPSLFPEA